MSKTETKKTTWSIDPGLRDEFVIACVRRHVTQSRGIQEAVQAWIARRPTVPEGAPEDAATLMAFPEFLKRSPAAAYVKELILAWLNDEERLARGHKAGAKPGRSA